jgi:hypothetical protein
MSIFRALAISFASVATYSASAATPPVTTQTLQTIPLVAHEQGQAMMQQAMTRLLPDVTVTFLDKDYENDQYVKDPITGNKVRTACLRFRASSGFRFKMDPPQHSLTTQQLTVTANIARIRADGLAFKFMPGPCAWVGAGFGVQLTDVKLVYKARPMLTFDGANGACRLVWNNDPNGLAVSIGDLNIIGVQNNLDGLAKNAVREALNFSLDAAFGSGLRGELQKVVLDTCGGARVRVR